MKRFLYRFVLIVAGLIVLWVVYSPSPPGPPSFWGVNFKIDPSADKTAALRELSRANVTYLRQDIFPDADAGAWNQQHLDLLQLTSAGKQVVGTVPYHLNQDPQQPGNALYEDLRLVFASARNWELKAGPSVAVWENLNEPDMGFCHDLPDRSTAYMKAVYLGLKEASGGTKPVLLPAMGLPPGPWLERARRNGLLDYGDAYNFHYYSRASDFSDAIQLARNFLEKHPSTDTNQTQWPLWVTEIGLDSVPRDNLDLPAARNQQAEFFQMTTQAAVEAKLASFMPYAFYDKAMPQFSLIAPDDNPYPAWITYAQQTQSLSLSSQPKWLNPYPAASPVILQWLPDPGSCDAFKAGGTYRFHDYPKSREPITGELRIYSFSKTPLHGTLRIRGLNQISCSVAGKALDRKPSDEWQDLGQPAPGYMEMKTYRLTFIPPAHGYFREWFEANFSDPAAPEKTQSNLYFGLEAEPQLKDFAPQQVFIFTPPQEGQHYKFQEIDEPNFARVSSVLSPWIGINGLEITKTKSKSDPAWIFRLHNPSFWPTQPPMAITTVKGLPEDCFLHLGSDAVFGQSFFVRVDLVDDRGQRFSISEHCGMSYVKPSKELWLNMHDFHRYNWGRFVTGHDFSPSAVREIQLRFYFSFVDNPVSVKLQVLKSR